MSLKIRRGTDAERLLITPEEGELIYTTDTKELYVGDGETPGGNLTSDNHAGTVTSVTGTGTIAGIALSGTVTTSGNLTLGGTLAVPVANITATGTKDSTTFLRGDGSWAAPVSGSTLPTQTGNSGKVLTTDGTNLSWTTNGNGTVTSVTGTGTVAGISLSGTVNSAGSLTLGGTLAVPIGNITATGTSDSTTFLRGDGSWAIPVSGSLLPTQIGNNGKVLTTDGTSLSWTTITSGTLLPIQTGNSGKVLTTNGTDLSWITPPMGGTLTSNLNTSTSNITNGSNLTINGSTGNVTTSKLVVHAGQNIQNWYSSTDSAGNHGYIESFSCRGTTNSPQSVLPGDPIFTLRASAHDGIPNSEYQTVGGIAFQVGNYVSEGDIPGNVILFSFDRNSQDAPTKTATLDQYGDFTIFQGVRLGILSAAPTNPVSGTFYIANQTSWNPGSKVTARPYPVFYDGVSYNSLY
jgi:hypothetical protein